MFRHWWCELLYKLGIIRQIPLQKNGNMLICLRCLQVIRLDQTGSLDDRWDIKRGLEEAMQSLQREKEAGR